LRVLVVGGAGYIGSVTVVELLAAGHEVLVLDDLSTGHRQAVHPEAELAVAEMGDRDLLDRLLSTHAVDAVVYLAGRIVAPESLRRPDLYFQSNIAAAITVLNAIVAHGVERLVFSSSAAVYGEPATVPIPEDAPLHPINPYGETKAAIERLLPWYEAAFGLRSVALRYFNAAGATGSLGEDHRPETHLIPLVLQVALAREAVPGGHAYRPPPRRVASGDRALASAELGKERPITIYGSDYPTPDGTCIRDYIHVADLARAHVLALERCVQGRAEGPGGLDTEGKAIPLRGSPGPGGSGMMGSAAYNLGTGRGYSNREVIETARRVTGCPIPVEEGPRRPGDPPVLVAKAERAMKELRWRPRFSDLETILDSAWEWHRRHPTGYET